MTAIILVGGKSLRMGQNKAFLRCGDKTFIEHQIDKLSKLFDEIILSANDVNTYSILNIPIVPDITPGKGPLGGICAGLMHAKSFHSFVIACDMPFINESVILYLKELINGFDVVVPQTSRGLEPMHAFYSKNCIAPIRRCIEEEKLRIIDFFPSVNVRIVDEKELAELDAPMQSLVNLNTPGEYKKHF